MEENTEIDKILKTIPMPAFVAQHNGNIVFANESFLEIAGQPDLTELDRTIYGLGIFHNPAEFRGFLQSFKHGGKSRRLVLPMGRFKSPSRQLIVYACLLDWHGSQSLCGILSISNTSVNDANLNSRIIPLSTLQTVLNKVNNYIIKFEASGKITFANASLLEELGYESTESLPSIAVIDAENDQRLLPRIVSQTKNNARLEYDTTFQRKDGTLFPVGITIQANHKIGNLPEFILTAFNLSEYRRQQQQRQQLEIENAQLKTKLERRSVLISEKFGRQDEYKIITKSPAYEKILHQIKQVAATDSTVLITGETGTGKELIARSIHAQSLRASRPLLILNCGALPAELIESELFGYRKGAFTGARNNHLGRFELADEGTLFLDEIGEMPILLQTRLLRVLQDGDFTPLGAKESIRTDVRIIAATNRDLKKQVEEGTFRSDLFFRLNVFPIHSLALRERPEDIPVLLRHFIRKHSTGSIAETIKVRDEDMERLREYPFNGNVRELENIVQRALIVSSGDTLLLDLDNDSDARTDGSKVKIPENLNFEAAQRDHITYVLGLTDGKVSGKGGAAELLGLNPQTLFSKMRKLGIDRRGN